MKKTVAKTVAALLGGSMLAALAATGAQAADYTPPPEPAGPKFAFTPRVWYVWQNDFYFQNFDADFVNGASAFQQSNEAASFPFWGGSFSMTPEGSNITYSLTALYGQGSSKVVGAGGIVLPIDPGEDIVVARNYNANVDVQRLDIEGIAQIGIAEGLTAVVGGRYINFERKEKGLFQNAVAGTPDVVPDNCVVTEYTVCNVDARFSLEQAFYLGELGFGVQRPMNDSGLIFFGNLTGMFGAARVNKASTDVGVFNVPKDDLEGAVIGVDTNAGAGFAISPNVFLSGRYRLFYLSAPGVKFDDGGTFIHGPEVNLTFTFGG